LRSETGANITVGKDDDLITLVGGKFYSVTGGVTQLNMSFAFVDAQSVEYAKEAIVNIASRRGARF
jgi:hypothetical protein